jgi:hypothetical protein
MKPFTRSLVRSLKNPLVQRILMWVVPIIISRILKRMNRDTTRKR